MIDVIEDAKRLKARAKYYKDKAGRTSKDGSYEENVARLEIARDLLEKAVTLLQTHYEKAADESSSKNELSRELADCYGIMGGIYRRRAALENKREYLERSAEMYKTGLKYEIDDSYNLFNSIVIQILLDPEHLEKYYLQIEKARFIIQEQVKGTRRDQWWAWADLGLIDLLLGKEEEAHYAYDNFGRAGTRPQDYESTLSVLSTLEETLHTSSSPTAHMVAHSMKITISLLEMSKTK